MLPSVTAPAAAAPAIESGPMEARTLDTRFGPIAVDPARVVTLPGGLFGFAHRTRFILSEIEDRNVPFMLLQSVEDPGLGFLVLPLPLDQGPVERRDLAPAGERAGIAPDNLIALAIVTLRAAPGDVRCTINLKAPILIDAERRTGAQQVLTSDAYDVRHPLPLGRGDVG